MNTKLQDDKYFSDHDYDGIKELNNPSPYWVLFLFLGTIAFSLFYAVHYFGYPNNGRDQVSEYNKQMAEAGKQLGQNPGELSAAVIFTKEQVAEGSKLFLEKGCIACHGISGRGDGPVGLTLNPRPADLTQHAIPGVHTDAQLFQFLTDGVPNSRMPSFKSKLSEIDRWNLVNFIRTLAPK